MAQLMQPFNPMLVDPTQGGGGGFPVGKHPVVAKSAEIKPTSKNDGGMLVFVLEVIDGPAKGNVGDFRLNLYNNNPQACDIAQKQLSAICHSVGQFQLGATGTDVSVLFGIPFIIEVGYQKGHAPGEEGSKGYTEIKKVYDIQGNEPGKAPAQQAPAQGGFAQQQQPAQQAAAFGGGFQQPQQTAPAATGWAQPQQEAQQPQQSQPAGAWAQPAQQAATPAANGARPAWAK